MKQYDDHLLKYIHLLPHLLIVFLVKNHHLTAPLWRGAADTSL